jgi:hypothetical protein
MRFSTLSIALCAAIGLATAAPAPGASVHERANASAPHVWEVAPSDFKVVSNVTAVHDLPAGTKGHTKREAEALPAPALAERTVPFSYVLAYGSTYETYPNTYYYLPYIYNTCFSLDGTNMNKAFAAVNILNIAVNCYFFVDDACGFMDGYTYATYDNTPLDANAIQYHAWSSYICYGL